MPSSVDLSTVKCVVIGDGAVGKTCLLISYAKGDFPREYVPTVFDNFAVSVEVGGQKITLNLLDTAGQEDYDRLRPLSYSNASVFLLCFSVTNRISFENIRDKWFPELRRYAPGVPFILVGTQVDRRMGSASSSAAAVSSNTVSQAEGLRVAKDLGAVSYIECSALTREGLREVFVNAILAALDPKKARASGVYGGGNSGSGDHSSHDFASSNSSDGGRRSREKSRKCSIV